MAARLDHVPDRFLVLLRDLRCLQYLSEAQDHVEGGTELMAHPRQELALGQIGLLCRFPRKLGGCECLTLALQEPASLEGQIRGCGKGTEGRDVILAEERGVGAGANDEAREARCLEWDLDMGSLGAIAGILTEFSQRVDLVPLPILDRGA